MAVVLSAYASYLEKLITELVDTEMPNMIGVSSEIHKIMMKRGVADLKALLPEAEKRSLREEGTKRRLGTVKDLMYQISNILDLCQIEIKEERCASRNMGCCNSLLSSMRDKSIALKIVGQMKDVNQKLLDSILQAHQGRESNPTATSPRLNEPAPASSQAAKNFTVGKQIVKDEAALVRILINREGNSMNEEGIPAVAIVGASGIGKTALADNILGNHTIAQHFEPHNIVRVSVGNEYDANDLLIKVLRQLRVNGCSDGHESPEDILSNGARGRKLLILMDDMWSSSAWNDLLRYPLKDCAPGSRLLITTNNENVADELVGAPKHIHRVKKLGMEDSWCLFKRQVLGWGDEESKVEALKCIGLAIIKKCDGLPLVIKLVSGLLRKNYSAEAWERVLKQIERVDVKEFNDVIDLSYQDLPSDLKQCFLYCPLFLKDGVINCVEIVQMWIVEGLILGDGNLVPEDVGFKYLVHLTKKNLLQRLDGSDDQLNCTMQKDIRSFAELKAADEISVNKYDDESLHEERSRSGSKLRWLSVSAEKVDYSALKKHIHLRALILCGNITINTGDSLSCFAHLRTLHVNHANFTVLVNSLCHLKHLRYLDLSHTDISALPHDIGKMIFLQYICIRGCRNLARLPDSVVQLKKLRHLDIRETKIKVMPREFGNLENLVSVQEFLVHMYDSDKDRCSLQELGTLSNLMHLTLKGLQNVSSSSMAAHAKLGSMEHLRHLWLCCTGRLTIGGEVEDQHIQEVFNELCPPPSIEMLKVEGYFGRHLPSWMVTIASNLELRKMKRLELVDLAWCTQLPAGLGQLPCLEHLTINRAPCVKHIGEEFFFLPSNTSQAVGTTVFGRLKKLVFHGMLEWNEWGWEEHVMAMRALHSLQISICKLRHLPPGFVYQATALKEFILADARHISSVDHFKSIVELVVRSNPDLERIAHLPNLKKLTITACPKLKVLEGVTQLSIIELRDYEMKSLPGYLRGAQVKQLVIHCNLELFKLISLRGNEPEWKKIKHIQQVMVYVDETDDGVSRSNVFYARDSLACKTDITNSYIPKEEDFASSFRKCIKRPSLKQLEDVSCSRPAASNSLRRALSL